NGLSTQPCGTPVLSETVVEQVWPDLTFCGQSVRKSIIQLQREVLVPRSQSLVINLEGVTVLNAELKSAQVENVREDPSELLCT
ncbi:hypothetical protein DVA81_19275, partial [Acinetobacter baumannii]